MPSVRERLLGRVVFDGNTTCWHWAGAIGTHGYGVIGLGGRRTVTTHRLSWALHRGPVPDNLMVLHRCDIRDCVNPDHLYLGTVVDNARDLWARGKPYARIRDYITPEVQARATANLPRGAKHHRSAAKLTPAQVMAILADKRSQRVIAAEYGLCQQAVSRIKIRSNWRHLANSAV